MHAQMVDASQEIANLLAAFGPVPVTNVVQVANPRLDFTQLPRLVFVTVFTPTPQTTSLVLTASNIRVVASSEFSFGAVTRTELPDHLIVQDSLAVNKSSVPASTTVTLSEQFQRTQNVQIQQSVTHTSQESLNLGFKFSEVFSVGGQVTIGQSTTDGNVVATGSSDTVTRSQTSNVTVQPHTAEMAEIQMWPVNFEVAFTATVTVDADLSKNDKGYTMLSQIVDAPRRTFAVSGKITAVDASESRLVWFDIPYDPNLTPASNDFTIVPNYKLPQSITITPFHDSPVAALIIRPVEWAPAIVTHCPEHFGQPLWQHCLCCHRQDPRWMRPSDLAK